MDNEIISVTFLVLCYKQQDFIDDCVKGALAQDYPVSEFVFSDDASPDDSYEKLCLAVERYGQGRPVTVRKNAENMGLIPHFNLMMAKTTGELIVLAAGDDISFPERVSTLVARYLAAGRPSLLCSDVAPIDDAGRATSYQPPGGEMCAMLNIREAAESKFMYLGASGALSRASWLRYGDIFYPFAYEDLVLGFRALLDNSLEFIGQPLLYYRVGVGVSTLPEQVGADRDELIASRLKEIRLRHDVLAQRMRDIQQSGQRLPTIIRALNKRVARLAVRVNFYSARWRLLFDFFRRPAAFWSGVKREARYLRDL